MDIGRMLVTATCESTPDILFCPMHFSHDEAFTFQDFELFLQEYCVYRCPLVVPDLRRMELKLVSR